MGKDKKSSLIIKPSEIVVGLQTAVDDMGSDDPSRAGKAKLAWTKLKAMALKTLKYADKAENVTIKRLIDKGSMMLANQATVVATVPATVPDAIPQTNGDEPIGIWERLWPEDEPFYKKPGVWAITVVIGAYLWSKKGD